MKHTQQFYDEIQKEIERVGSDGYDILLDENITDEKIEYFLEWFNEKLAKDDLKFKTLSGGV